MKNIKDYVLDALFEIESFFVILLDYHMLPINCLFEDWLSHVVTHKISWHLWGRIYPDEQGKWRLCN
jgi:hypothetical protein